MSTMAVASRAARSSLNPNAPLFIPAAFQQVEDFSPEWWELVKTTTWFRDHWFRQHQEQETFDGDEEEDDIANLLPDSFDLGIAEEFSHFEAELEETEAAFLQASKVENELGRALPKKTVRPSFEDTEALIRSLSLKSPKNGAVKPVVDQSRYKEKPAQAISPKFSARRIIQQPR
ncbi:protein EARLY RESPONSIVE TO DEHYDRATION 15 [Phalaenopsis equestris]|uniref:protein EARLY RESPONSIVE TO DEHYDRATION 15 n=1 Tax=Phalaenopsis equestris TaxID=78828 RepID=UPI0009E5358E|nr:protein EARLY RESPONSIVE TO DEHYDRATION 15 [Phalaenopsis equestris]